MIALSAMSCGGNNDNPVDSPPCSDGEDNDGDGTIDFPDDLGCTSPSDDSENSPTMPACNDGRDNDGDGKMDYPNDPGCFAPQSDDESDNCPDGQGCPECGNGKDDDGNGATDYPNDPGCESAADRSEFLDNPVACGGGMKIKQLPATHMDMGELDTSSTSMIMSPCGGGAGSPGIAYVIHLTEPKVIVASTDDSGTTADTVIDIRGAECSQASSHLACSDDIDQDNTNSTVTKSLAAGTYYIIVEGHDTSAVGNYVLKVDFYAGEGSACAMQTECGPGLVCRTPVGASSQVCAKPVCSDGIDDDNDGKIDYPNDPGCGSPNGSAETDNCPGGAGCPECANGRDDDNDSKTDYPADTTCKAAGDASEACMTSEGVELITQPVTQGDTTGATNDAHPTCSSSSSTAADRTYRLDLPATTTLSLNLTGVGFDSATQLLNSTCGGTALSCSDPANMTVSNLAAGTYYFVVDGYFSDDVGPYTINVSGKIANNASCEGALAQSGALTCGAGFACKGQAGSRTCKPAQCSDNLDNNNDGKTDFPNDPGCASSSDDSETTVCPGPNCPVCANGLDDDSDGKIDYPQDTSCHAASGTSELCNASEGVTALTMPDTTGDTSTATDDFRPTCASSTHTAKDLTYQLDVPALDSLKIVLSSPTFFDAVTVLLNSTCGGTALTCSDPNTITMTNLAAGRYFYVVDGYSSGSGAFNINVSGTIKNNASCESALAQSGALTCGPAHTCKGTMGSRKCLPVACADGVDNNSDGKIDYPNDPGCSSPADDSETTVCPGASCPVCANGMDDDTDNLTDYPADFGCAAAGAMSEAFCSGETDFAGVITAPATMGSLATATDNYDQTCQSNTGNDVVYALQLPVPVQSLQIDTIGSTISDSVVSLKDASCGTDLGCDDDGDPAGFLSKLNLTNVPAGNYAIQVDAFGTSNNGEFVLNVKGTVKAQTACTSPLFAAQVLKCPSGTTCTGGKCQ
ncbi:MAG TPA: PPC domain-containing protein [Kofleriaceae bacterium]|nr:PPC domain-containing protein [Kofleriaceae bacterium]